MTPSKTVRNRSRFCGSASGTSAVLGHLRFPRGKCTPFDAFKLLHEVLDPIGIPARIDCRQAAQADLQRRVIPNAKQRRLVGEPDVASASPLNREAWISARPVEQRLCRDAGLCIDLTDGHKQVVSIGARCSRAGPRWPDLFCGRFRPRSQRARYTASTAVTALPRLDALHLCAELAARARDIV